MIPAGFKPMLAVQLPQGELPKFPCYVSPKLDGVRAVVFGGVVYSRKLEPIPNRHVQETFGTPLLEGYDGELIVGPPTDPHAFTNTTSGVMSVEGAPKVVFHVFDHYTPHVGFWERIRKNLTRNDQRARISRAHLPVQLVVQRLVTSPEELLEAEQEYLDQGYEGAMIRSVDGPYKCGRSTAKEGYLLKMKRFLDAEAEIVGYEELEHNQNALQKDALGHAKRSSAKAGKTLGGVLGNLLCRTPEGVDFSIGGGFTADDRIRLWAERETLVGKLAKYKYFPTGSKTAPRFPTFIGIRDRRDA